ncbi:MAG: hypothetical protein ACE5OR_06580, partial [bacterium]
LEHFQFVCGEALWFEQMAPWDSASFSAAWRAVKTGEERVKALVQFPRGDDPTKFGGEVLIQNLCFRQN